MKIIVPIKQVPDPGGRLRLKPDEPGVDTAGVRMVSNPFDEIALEQAVRLKEAGTASEVVAVTIGPTRTAEVLRAALACGATRAIRITTDAPLEPLDVTKCLRVVVEREAATLVLAGKQSTDGDNNQVGQMLAGLLGWPQATFASSVSVENDRFVSVTREVDEGLQTLRLPLPAIVTADLRLCEPRYASLPNIMKAKKQPIAEIALDTLGVDVAPKLKMIEMREPPPRPKGVMVASVDELIERLRHDAKVL